MKSAGGLWAITCFFNPLHSRRRLSNYRTFRARLDVPLAAVELVYGEPELSPADAEVLIQRRGRDVMWQKERLLNIALASLPSDCRLVAVLDADLVFVEADWMRRARDALDERPLCQIFRYAYELPRDQILTMPPRREWPFWKSLVSMLADGAELRRLFEGPKTLREQGCHPGLAWAARREILETHGLYEACIMGGAYPAMACAALGEFGLAERFLEMNARQRAHFRSWSEPFYSEAQGRLGFAENTLLHLWHGNLSRRRYRERYTGLVPFKFDPHQDLATDDTGCWRWATGKPELHAYVRDYFAGRREDE